MRKQLGSWLIRHMPVVVVVCWGISMLSVIFTPDSFAYTYGTIWLAGAAILSLYFFIGYSRYAQIRGDNGHISPEASWLMSKAVMFLTLTLYLLLSRLLNPPPPDRFVTQYTQYTFGAFAFLTVFWLQAAIATLWTYRQITVRRRLARDREVRKFYVTRRKGSPEQGQVSGDERP